MPSTPKSPRTSTRSTSKPQAKKTPSKPVQGNKKPSAQANRQPSAEDKSNKTKAKPAQKTRLRRDPNAKHAAKRMARQAEQQQKLQTRRGKRKPPASVVLTGKDETIRLNKLIADSGICSRRTADQWIAQGRVTVNMEPITTVGTQVSLRDIVLVDGNPLPHKPPVYVLFHKPVGLITTKSDNKGRDTIYDVLPKKYHHCDPAGRLDRQSSGALILSNDGEFIHKISHPSFPLDKVYRVRVDEPFKKSDKKRLKEGVLLEPENKLAKVKECQMVDEFTLTLTLRTGYNRQIRRTLAALGYTVTTLRRLAVGPIELTKLAVGKCRVIEPELVKAILNPPKAKSARKPAKKPSRQS